MIVKFIIFILLEFHDMYNIHAKDKFCCITFCFSLLCSLFFFVFFSVNVIKILVFIVTYFNTSLLFVFFGDNGRLQLINILPVVFDDMWSSMLGWKLDVEISSFVAFWEMIILNLISRVKTCRISEEKKIGKNYRKLYQEYIATVSVSYTGHFYCG